MHRILVLLAIGLAALPSTAAAVELGTVDGQRFTAARNSSGDLCFRASSPGTRGFRDCDRPPSSLFEPTQFSWTENGPFAVAVPGRAVAAEVTDAAGTRPVTLVAVPGLRVRAGVSAPAGPGAVLRFRDAAGAVIGAAIPERDTSADPPTATVRAGKAVLTLRRTVALDPDPLEPGRVTTVVCRESSGGREGSFGFCPPTRPLDVEVIDVCPPGRPALVGTAADRVRRVVVTLGDGRRRRAATTTLPDGLGRGVALTLPRGLAVRDVRGLDAEGHRVARVRLAAAPSGGRCAPDAGASIGTGIAGTLEVTHRPVAPLRTVARAGGARLQAADGPGRRLCERIDGRRPSCTVPPVEAGGAVLRRAGSVVHGVVSRDTARLELRLRGGGTLRARTTAGTAYTGRFAGLVRFAVVRVPPGRAVAAVVARDAGGRALGRPSLLSARLRTTRRPLGGGLVLERSTFRSAGRREVTSCVRVARTRAQVCGVTDEPSTQVRAEVPCRPRRALVVGRLPPGATAAVAVLADGRRLIAPAFAVPGVGTVWRLVLPRRAALRRIELPGLPRRDRRTGVPLGRQPLRLPPAAEQCGYVATP